jgi:hypothetical protein
MADDYQILLDAPVKALAQVQIAKLGDFSDDRYGDFSITADEVKAWQANLAKLPGGKAPIDFDHLADKPGAARKTEAAGWITSVELADGVPVAEVEWTPIGENAIAEKRYQFFSPSYGPFKDETGQVTPDVLQGGALTNKPFLNMPTVNLSRTALVATELDALTGQQRKNLPASDFVFPETRRYPIPDIAHARDALARSSGKPEEAAVRAAVHKRYPQLAGKRMGNEPGADSRRHMPEITPRMLEIVGLTQDADETAITTKLTELAAEPKTLDQLAKDAGKVVLDQAEHDKLKGDAGKAGALEVRVNTLESERADEKFDAAFATAQGKGRVDAKPETRTTYRELYDASADATLKLLAALPDNGAVNVTPNGAGGDLPEGEAPAGVDPDAYELDRKVQAHMAAEKAAGRDPNYVKSLEAVRQEA